MSILWNQVGAGKILTLPLRSRKKTAEAIAKSEDVAGGVREGDARARQGQDEYTDWEVDTMCRSCREATGDLGGLLRPFYSAKFVLYLGGCAVECRIMSIYCKHTVLGGHECHYPEMERTDQEPRTYAQAGSAAAKLKSLDDILNFSFRFFFIPFFFFTRPIDSAVHPKHGTFCVFIPLMPSAIWWCGDEGIPLRCLKSCPSIRSLYVFSVAWAVSEAPDKFVLFYLFLFDFFSSLDYTTKYALLSLSRYG